MITITTTDKSVHFSHNNTKFPPNSLAARWEDDRLKIFRETNMETIVGTVREDVTINGELVTESNWIDLTEGLFNLGSGTGGEGGGVSPTNHNSLLGRNAANAHPISSITGLETELYDIKQSLTWIMTKI